MSLMKKRILVTGGAGFIGSHLCELLLKEGKEVLCLDNFYTGRRGNIVHLLNNPYFEVLRHDICFPLYVEADEIYNLACPASPIHYQFDPVQTTKTSVHGSINMLGLAKRLKIKILQASTSEVYGDPVIHPQPESYWGNVNPVGIRSCYDEGKRCAETLFFDYHRQHNLKIKVARIFNTYGPRHTYDVIPKFIELALNNKPLTVHGSGEQSRDFTYVDDMIEAFLMMGRHKSAIGKAVNFGTGQAITVNYIAKKVKELSDSSSEIIHTEERQSQVPKLLCNYALAEKIFGWKPKVFIDEGLRRNIEWEKQKK